MSILAKEMDCFSTGSPTWWNSVKQHVRYVTQLQKDITAEKEALAAARAESDEVDRHVESKQEKDYVMAAKQAHGMVCIGAAYAKHGAYTQALLEARFAVSIPSRAWVGWAIGQSSSAGEVGSALPS